ncbi:hypothetical protein D3C72_1784630 [compost metagenome]
MKGCLLCVVSSLLRRFARLDLAFARRRAQDVHQDAHGQHSIQPKGDQRAQHRALGTGGFCHGHHEGDVGPGNYDQVH